MDGNRLKCSAIIRNSIYKNDLINEVIQVVESLEMDFVPIKLQKKNSIYTEISNDILDSDLLIVDITLLNSSLFYELGIAYAGGKHIIFLVKHDYTSIPSNIRNYNALPYNPDIKGFNNLKSRLNHLILDILNSPSKKSILKISPEDIFSQPHIIDLESLDRRTLENMCFELLVQMGFRQVKWNKHSSIADILALNPKKDPDGYEFSEQWIVSLSNGRVESDLYNLIDEPEYYLEKYLFGKGKLPRTVNDYTILIISKSSKNNSVDQLINRFDYASRRRLKNQSFRNIKIRIRHWPLSRLLQLLQDRPNIVAKYFSNNSQYKSDNRKSFESLYKENLNITLELRNAKKALESEKKLRFNAERDAAWKDIAFKAAHKLGNPIDAVDTFVQGLKRRLDKINQRNQLVHILAEIDNSIEDAKSVIEQLTSLTRASKINLKEIDLKPIIDKTALPFKEEGVNVKIECRKKCPKIIADKERITECFQELFANSKKWFKKDQKSQILIKITLARSVNYPEDLSKSKKYLKIQFVDNGYGIAQSEKENIFTPFYSKSLHNTGLGLSLVKNIIDKHEGMIRENGNLNKGAKFEIYLPISNERK